MLPATGFNECMLLLLCIFKMYLVAKPHFTRCVMSQLSVSCRPHFTALLLGQHYPSGSITSRAAYRVFEMIALFMLLILSYNKHLWKNSSATAIRAVGALFGVRTYFMENQVF